MLDCGRRLSCRPLGGSVVTPRAGLVIGSRMHWIDLVIVGIVALTTFAAFSSGLIRQVVTLVFLILGALLAGQFYDELAADITFLVDDQSTRNFIAFAAIFGGLYLVGQILATVLNRTAALLMLGPLDHLGGAVFGLLQGLLLVELALIAVTTFPMASGLTAAVEDSALAPLFLDVAPVLLGLLPQEFRDAVDAMVVMRW